MHRRIPALCLGVARSAARVHIACKGKLREARRTRTRGRRCLSQSQNVMSGVSLVANAYLDDNTAKIRFKPVPWEVRPSTPASTHRLPI
jgi:hypothetical protein